MLTFEKLEATGNLKPIEGEDKEWTIYPLLKLTKQKVTLVTSVLDRHSKPTVSV